MPAILSDRSAAYFDLVAVLRAGQRPPIDRVDAVLALIGKTRGELLADVLAPGFITTAGPAPGDPCRRRGCPGALVVTSSKRRGKLQIQTMACPVCETKPIPPRRLVAADTIRRRKNRLS